MSTLVFVFMLMAHGRGYNLAFEVARHYSDKPVLCEEIPLYTPSLKRFATIYIFGAQEDTITIVTGDNNYSRPLYEYGRGVPGFMLINRMNYKTSMVVYTGYSTYFLYTGDRFWDTRYLKYQNDSYVDELFRKRIVFKDYSKKWTYYETKGFKLDEYNEIDGVPAYLWSYGCSPTASAMILGYWDKRGYGRLIDYYFDHYDVVLGDTVRNVPNVQRELAIYMDADTTTGYTDWAPISTGTENCANMENGYSFISRWVYDTIVYDTACAYDTAYMYLKQEVDSGRPVHWAVGNYLDQYGRIIEHSTCAFGYQVTGADTFVILHNTWDLGTWAWPLYTTDSTYIALYNVIPGGEEIGNVNDVNVSSPVVNNLYFPLYISYDDAAVIGRVELYYSSDNANTWTLLGEISTDTEIIRRMDFTGSQSVRFMVKTYDSGDNLISAESTPYSVKIIYPAYDGIFNARGFTTISPEPRTVNLVDGDVYVGTTYGIVSVLSNDSILFKDTVFGNPVFSSAQYDSLIVYGMYNSGFSVYSGKREVYHDSTQGYVSDVTIDSERVCVFERDLGFRIINYQNGFTQDTVLANGSYFMTGGLFDRYIYVGTLRHGFIIYDVNLGEFIDTIGSGRVYDIEIAPSDSLLYVLFAGYLKVYDIKVPDAPLLLDSIPVSGATHIRGSNNRVFVIRGTSGVDIYTFVSGGYVKSSISDIGMVKDVCEEDSTLYIVTGDGLVFQVDYLGSGVGESNSEFKWKNSVILRGDMLILGEGFRGRYSVYDRSGRRILRGYAQNGMIKLKGLPSGAYVVKFKNRTLRVLKIN